MTDSAEAPKTAPAATAPDAGGAAPAATAALAETDVRNLQAKFNHLVEQRNQLNDMARASRETRDQLNEQRRVKSAEIEEFKVARDAANEVMRQHKELRNQYQEQAKALIADKKGKTGNVERSLPLTVRKLRNDLQALVEQQQTTQLTVAKERVLVEKISEMWKELKAREQELQKQKAVEIDLSDTDGTIDAMFAKADEEHEKVVAAMKVAQENHEKFIAGVKEIRILVTESNKKHEEFIACKTKADENHNKAMDLREKVMAVREMKKAEYDAQRQEVREVNTVARRNVADPRALDRLKDDAFEQLKKGGKISLGF